MAPITDPRSRVVRRALAALGVALALALSAVLWLRSRPLIADDELADAWRAHDAIMAREASERGHVDPELVETTTVGARWTPCAEALLGLQHTPRYTQLRPVDVDAKGVDGVHPRALGSIADAEEPLARERCSGFAEALRRGLAASEPPSATSIRATSSEEVVSLLPIAVFEALPAWREGRALDVVSWLLDVIDASSRVLAPSEALTAELALVAHQALDDDDGMAPVERYEQLVDRLVTMRAHEPSRCALARRHIALGLSALEGAGSEGTRIADVELSGTDSLAVQTYALLRLGTALDAGRDDDCAAVLAAPPLPPPSAWRTGLAEVLGPRLLREAILEELDTAQRDSLREEVEWEARARIELRQLELSLRRRVLEARVGHCIDAAALRRELDAHPEIERGLPVPIELREEPGGRIVASLADDPDRPRPTASYCARSAPAIEPTP